MYNFSFLNLNSRMLPHEVELQLCQESLSIPDFGIGVPFSGVLFDSCYPRLDPLGAPQAGKYAELIRHQGTLLSEPYDSDEFHKGVYVGWIPSEQMKTMFHPVIQTPIYWVHADCPYLRYFEPLLVEEKKDIQSEDDSSDNFGNWVDYLGLFSLSSRDKMELPLILISPEKIWNMTGAESFVTKTKSEGISQEIRFAYILAKVVLHEMAHSLMWMPGNKREYHPNYRYIEESLANYITLIHLHAYSVRTGNADIFALGSEFVKHQSPAYRGGWLLWQVFGASGYEFAHFWRLVKSAEEGLPDSYTVTVSGEPMTADAQGMYDYEVTAYYANGNRMFNCNYPFSSKFVFGKPGEERMIWSNLTDRELINASGRWKQLCEDADMNALTDEIRREVSHFTFCMGIRYYILS
jgi:hypothetical protein